MITIYFWLFITLCVFAFGGLVAFIFLIYALVIEPIRDIVSNYKTYKEFYIEHSNDKFRGRRRRKIEVEEDER